MEIILGKTAGFCYGVKNAVERAKEDIQPNKTIYCVGELVHNQSVINDLKNRGIKFVDNIEEVKDKIIIRAHGVPKETYEKLQQKGIEIKDLTCPNVRTTHTLAETYSQKGYFIILMGIKKHPEAIGTISFCGKDSFLLQKKEEIPECLKKIKQSNAKDILIMAQTTYHSKRFDEIVSLLKKELKDKNVEIRKTICHATEIRQKETIEIAQKVEAMVIIGDKKSSNTRKLYSIAKEYCRKVIFAQNAEELKLEELGKAQKIGIMAGASTPKVDIEEIIKKIRSKDLCQI